MLILQSKGRYYISDPITGVFTHEIIATPEVIEEAINLY